MILRLNVIHRAAAVLTLNGSRLQRCLYCGELLWDQNFRRVDVFSGPYQEGFMVGAVTQNGSPGGPPGLLPLVSGSLVQTGERLPLCYEGWADVKGQLLRVGEPERAAVCAGCRRGDVPRMLDDDGVVWGVSGRLGIWSHAAGDKWWPCDGVRPADAVNVTVRVDGAAEAVAQVQEVEEAGGQFDQQMQLSRRMTGGNYAGWVLRCSQGETGQFESRAETAWLAGREAYLAGWRVTADGCVVCPAHGAQEPVPDAPVAAGPAEVRRVSPHIGNQVTGLEAQLTGGAGVWQLQCAVCQRMTELTGAQYPNAFAAARAAYSDGWRLRDEDGRAVCGQEAKGVDHAG